VIVFPESINAIPKSNPEDAFRIIEDYIRYMCQRTDWAISNVGKTVSAAGVSSTETYMLLQTLQNTVSALQSTVNSQGSSISALLQSATTLGNDYAELAGRVSKTEAKYTALELRVGETEKKYAALEQRVAALENSGQEVL
jgi:peptidoglycan hydrolase CwlO-like protein